MDQISQLKCLLSEKVAVYSGDDSLTLPMLSLGAAGVVSIASHLIGKEIKEMLKSFAGGDFDKALTLHLQLFPMFKGLFITTNPVPLKEALNLLGMQVGGLRLPLSGASAKEIDYIKGLLKGYGLGPA